MATVPSLAEIQYQEAHIHDSRIGTMVAASAASVSLAFIAVVLRFLSRRVAKVKYEWDDWLALSGFLLLIVCMIIDTQVIHYGAGRHSILITNPKEFALYLIVSEVMYQPALVCIKASLLYLYYRVFFVSRAFITTLWAVGIFVVCYSIPQIFCAIFQCTPIDANWDPTVKVNFCINVGVAATVLAGLNVLTDFALLILPMPLLYQLQMPTTQKYQVMGTFLLGGFVTFASIYRCVVIHNLGHADPSWDEDGVYVWTQVELGVGVVSVCLPTMRPLFAHLPRVFRSASSSLEQGGGERKESDPSLNNLQQSNSNPSQSAKFAHLGVLGTDLEEGKTAGVTVGEPTSEKQVC